MGMGRGTTMPRYYEIQVVGHLDPSWSDWFDGLAIAHLPTGQTLLSGDLVDQAALHGVLMKVRDLGLPLIAVVTIDRPAEHPASS
jgi:hypothetical protein